jgi:hypothetical protein
VKTEAIPNSLTPFLASCPNGYYNACLEACTRDVTTCCYYQGPLIPPTKPAPPTPSYQNSWKIKPFKCRNCGQTDPDKFYAGHPSTCGACIQKLRSADYKKKKIEKERPITRPCRKCGVQFWRQHKERFLDCPECRVKRMNGG